MKTDEEYEAVLKELRAEIGEGLNLTEDAIDMIPAVDPKVIRHYAERFAAAGLVTATEEAKPAKNDEAVTATKMHKKTEQFLNARYKGPQTPRK